jgi:hypothetical protein
MMFLVFEIGADFCSEVPVPRGRTMRKKFMARKRHSKISEPLICVQTWTAREKERCHNTSAEKKIPTVITHSHHESHKLDKKGQKREL